MSNDIAETVVPLLAPEDVDSDGLAFESDDATDDASEAASAGSADGFQALELIAQKDDSELRTGTIPSSVINLINTVVGAGVLSLPFAFNKTGVFIGGSVLMLCYTLMVFSCWLLLECQEFCGAKSYRDIAKEAMGKKGVVALQFAMILSTFFTMVSYLIIVGDMFSVVIGEAMGGTSADMCSVFANRRFSMTLALMVVCPLSMLQNIDSLKYTSYAAIGSIMYVNPPLDLSPYLPSSHLSPTFPQVTCLPTFPSVTYLPTSPQVTCLPHTIRPSPA